MSLAQIRCGTMTDSMVSKDCVGNVHVVMRAPRPDTMENHRSYDDRWEIEVYNHSKGFE